MKKAGIVFFSLKRRWPGINPITVFQYQKGSYREDGVAVITRMLGDRQWAEVASGKKKLSDCKSEDKFSQWRREFWSILPRKVVESPSLEVLKIHFDRILDNQIQSPAYNRRLELLIPRDPFKLRLLCYCFSLESHSFYQNWPKHEKNDRGFRVGIS